MIKYISLFAGEEITNNTICVVIMDTIRTMQYRGDINGKLVFVDQVPKFDQDENFKIKKGELIRCVELTVVPKVVI